MTPDEWAEAYIQRRDRHLTYYDGLEGYWWPVLQMSIYDAPWPTPDEVRDAAAAGKREVFGDAFDTPSGRRYCLRVHMEPCGFVDVRPTASCRVPKGAKP